MYGKIFVSTFGKLWDKIGLTFVSSLIAAINPLFFMLNLSLVRIFNNNLRDLMTSPGNFMVFTFVFLACSSVFPTTMIGIAMIKKIAENELIYIRHYFTDLPGAFRDTIIPSLILTVIYGALGYLVSTGILFYFKNVPDLMLKSVLIIMLLILFLFAMMVQFIAIPCIIYRKELGLVQAMKFAATMCLVEFPTVIAVFLTDAAFFLLFSFLNGASLFVYYIVSGFFRVYLCSELLSKYPRLTNKPGE